MKPIPSQGNHRTDWKRKTVYETHVKSYEVARSGMVWCGDGRETGRRNFVGHCGAKSLWLKTNTSLT